MQQSTAFHLVGVLNHPVERDGTQYLSPWGTPTRLAEKARQASAGRAFRSFLALLILFLGNLAANPAYAAWQAAIGGGNGVDFDDPIAACTAQYQAVYGYSDYVYGGITFTPATGIPTFAICTWNHTSSTLYPPTLSSYATLVCSSGQTESAQNASGCISNSAGIPGANNGTPTPAGKSSKGNDCTDCSVGEPINPGSGNEFLAENDYRSASDFPLEFTRYYNSYSGTTSSKIGAQWRHTYDRSITTSSTDYSVTIANVIRQDGKVDQYYSRDGVTWLPINDLVDTLQASYANNVLTGWKFTTADDQTEVYNAAGALLSITDRVGRQQALSYNTQGQLAQISDSYGRTLLLAYDSSGRVHTLTNPASGVFTYAYDGNNNLQTVTYPDSTVRTYVYNESSLTSGANLPNKLTGIVDENGARYVSVGYNASGLALLDYLGNGVNQYSIQYSAGGADSAIVTDPLGTQRTYTFAATNGVNQITSFSAPGSAAACGICSSAKSFTYDANGFISGETDGNNNLTTYSVDGRGLEETRVEAAETPQSRETDTTWETNFHLPHQVSEPGRTTVYSHDPTFGNLLSVTLTDTQTGTTRVTAYSNYNALGEPQTMVGPRTDISQIAQYQYDAQGNLRQVTDPLGHITKITQYDANGNPEIMLDPNGVETDFSYDPRQRLLSKKVAGALTQFGYDKAGNLKTVTLPNGTQIGRSYDTAHRLTDITDNAGDHIHYTLDGPGNRTTEDTYDPSGNLVRTVSRNIDPTTGWVSDLLGAHGQDTHYTYDGVGDVRTQTQVTAAANYETFNTYDPLNRLSQTQAADQGITNYGYDPFGHLETVQDPASLTTTYTYNGLGDLTQLSSPDTGITQYTPDSAGNISVKKDARPISVSYSYDALNRITSATYPASAENVTYYYDGSNYAASKPYAIGHLTGIADQSGTTTYYYNPRGTLSSEVHVVSGSSYTTSYIYDLADNLTSITYPSGDSVTYVLNSLGQVTTVNAVLGGTAETLASNVLYMPFGPWKQQTLGNGITTTRTIDTDYRVSAIVSGKVVNRSYAYTDGRNNITGITDNVTSSDSQTFGYDPMSRVSSASGSYGNLAYTYNTSGDRTEGGSTYLLSGYTYASGSHQLKSYGSTNYVYDAIGNTEQSSMLGLLGKVTYTYDDANRLASASSTGSPAYTYNAAGQRVVKATSGLLGATKTVYSYGQSGLLLQEGTSASDLSDEYFYLNGEPLALYTKPALLGSLQAYYYHNDHLGTPQVLTNSSGTKVWAAQYQPFGTVSIGTQTITNNLRKQGQYSDSSTGFYQNGFRDYNPAIGRYIESDPVGLGGGINTYAYAGGNPVNNFDPSGLDCQSARGITTCHYPDGPAFSIPTPPNFPDYIGPDDFLYHHYDVPVSENCPDDEMMQGLINNPAPGNPMSPATPAGTPNVAQAYGINNSIISYVTTDLVTGNTIEVNVTTGTQLQGFSPGYVARAVSNGVVNNYGEGEAIVQSPYLFSLQYLLDASVWWPQTKSVAKKCGCSN